eukprot:5073286-Amphidinium_carterae.1
MFNLSVDGLTPFQRLRGRPWRIRLPSFGEVVWFAVPTSRRLEQKWFKGIYIGCQEQTTEKRIGTENGVIVAQSVRRLTDDGGRWDKDLLAKVTGYPWKPKPDKEKEKPSAIVTVPADPAPPVA